MLTDIDIGNLVILFVVVVVFMLVRYMFVYFSRVFLAVDDAAVFVAFTPRSPSVVVC